MGSERQILQKALKNESCHRQRPSQAAGLAGPAANCTWTSQINPATHRGGCKRSLTHGSRCRGGAEHGDATTQVLEKTPPGTCLRRCSWTPRCSDWFLNRRWRRKPSSCPQSSEQGSQSGAAPCPEQPLRPPLPRARALALCPCFPMAPAGAAGSLRPQTFPARLPVLQHLKKTGNDSTGRRRSELRDLRGRTGLCAALGHAWRAEGDAAGVTSLGGKRTFSNHFPLAPLLQGRQREAPRESPESAAPQLPFQRGGLPGSAGPVPPPSGIPRPRHGSRAPP